ncbi:MAG: DNA gyrase subunit A [Thermodesulfobacteriota bacterium]
MKDNTSTEGRPLTVSIEKEMKKSYLDYAMSVIIGRALPDVRDGFKPVHRRTLYAMRELNNFHNRPYLKSARIVGDIIGKYHPHGDTAAYDSVVRMAQDFSMRYPLVDGQGNFGSIDGDSPAAMRYTEARMTRIDQEIIADLDKDTVDFTPNYDNTLTEPIVLPTRIPNLLVNGSAGIAVGMATNIPPHNLSEIMDGLISIMDDPNITVNALLDHITGPDFPTGGFICGRGGIREAYETGRGSVLMRAREHIEKVDKGEKERIVFTEIPYLQNKARLIEKIAWLMKEKKIEGISEVRDESDRHGMRIVIDLKKGEIADVVINQLFELTPLQKSFGIIFLSIVNNKPEILNLKQILEHFILHRKSVVYRRTAYDLKKAKARAHILEGLSIALNNLDEVVQLVKTSTSPAEANKGLMKRFELTEIQAQAILDMRLQKLTGLEREKIVNELEELLKQIEWYEKVLQDDTLVRQIIRDECEEIKEKYGDNRKTELMETPDEILPEDLIREEDMVITVTHKGYIKRNCLELYRSQHRGGKGIQGVCAVTDDFVVNIYLASTHHTFLFFTNTGRVFWRKVYEIPQASRKARGKAIVNLLELRENEKVAAIMPIKSFSCDEGKNCSIFMATRKGVVKKTILSEFARPVRKGKQALKLREDDKIIKATLTDGSSEILLVTHKGMAVRFSETDVRAMGRIASGVRGIRLAENDRVVAAVVLEQDKSILVVTEKGFGKRSPVDEYRFTKRGGKGVFAIKASERNGNVVGACQVDDNEEVMLITDLGKIIRLKMNEIRIIGRNTQGVRFINLEEGEKVVGLDILPGGENGDDS